MTDVSLGDGLEMSSRASLTAAIIEAETTRVDANRSLNPALFLSGVRPLHHAYAGIMGEQIGNMTGQLMRSTGFMQWHNPDATANVICLCCFQTIARANSLADLLEAEDERMCNPVDRLVKITSTSTRN